MLTEHLTESDGMFTDSFGTLLNPLERSLHSSDGLSLTFPYPILSSKALIKLLQIDTLPVRDASAALTCSVLPESPGVLRLILCERSRSAPVRLDTLRITPVPSLPRL